MREEQLMCGHEGCTCEVEAEVGFCSDYCREHAGDTNHGTHICGCSHPQCQGSSSEADARTEDDIQAALE